jgi:hypothetical protein
MTAIYKLGEHSFSLMAFSNDQARGWSMIHRAGADGGHGA